MCEIPDWDDAGCLPYTVNRIKFSPYQVSSETFVKRFAKTPERQKLLNDWLTYRRRLSEYVSFGFQWINGSFVEDVEKKRGCPPNDIDLVDFIMLSKPLTADQYKHLKKPYKLDCFMVKLPTLEELTQFPSGGLQEWYNLFVDQTACWNLQWGHSQDNESKGYLKIPFSEEDDKKALDYLQSLGGIYE